MCVTCCYMLQVPVMKGGKVNSNVDMTMGPVDVDFDGRLRLFMKSFVQVSTYYHFSLISI